MLIITLEGGLVSGILTDNPELLKEKAIVVDYDTEGSEDCVVDMDGDDCCPSRYVIENARAGYVDDIAKITDEREAAGFGGGSESGT